MANRRKLKKNVNLVSNMAIGACMIAQLDHENTEATNELIFEVLHLRRDILSRISHTEPGSTKKFYKRLNEDFKNGIEEIIVKANELG